MFRNVVLVTASRHGARRPIAISIAKNNYDVGFTEITKDGKFEILASEFAALGARSAFGKVCLPDTKKHSNAIGSISDAVEPIDQRFDNFWRAVRPQTGILENGTETCDQNMQVDLQQITFFTQQIAKRTIAWLSNRYRAVLFITSIAAVISSGVRNLPFMRGKGRTSNGGTNLCVSAWRDAYRDVSVDHFPQNRLIYGIWALAGASMGSARRHRPDAGNSRFVRTRTHQRAGDQYRRRMPGRGGRNGLIQPVSFYKAMPK